MNHNSNGKQRMNKKLKCDRLFKVVEELKKFISYKWKPNQIVLKNPFNKDLSILEKLINLLKCEADFIKYLKNIWDSIIKSRCESTPISDDILEAFKRICVNWAMSKNISDDYREFAEKIYILNPYNCVSNPCFVYDDININENLQKATVEFFDFLIEQLFEFRQKAGQKKLMEIMENSMQFLNEINNDKNSLSKLDMDNLTEIIRLNIYLDSKHKTSILNLTSYLHRLIKESKLKFQFYNEFNEKILDSFLNQEIQSEKKKHFKKVFDNFFEFFENEETKVIKQLFYLSFISIHKILFLTNDDWRLLRKYQGQTILLYIEFIWFWTKKFEKSS